MKKEDAYKKSMKRTTIEMVIVVILLFIILLLIRIYAVRSEFDGLNFFESVLSDILVVIIPLLLFNVYYEYKIRVNQPNEMSEKITQAIMGNKEIMAGFQKSAKEQFIHATLLSVLQEEKGNVVYKMIDGYLQSKINIRKEYDYKIVLEEIKNSTCKTWNSYADKNDYYLICEYLSFIKKISDEHEELRNIYAGFFIENSVLNDHFKHKAYFFRENLEVKPEDFIKIKENKDSFIKDIMKLKAYLDKQPLAINSIEADDSGIIIGFKVPSSVNLDEDTRYEISFTMPQLKIKNSFQALIHEPTNKPQIMFIYPKDLIKLKAVPFFDEKNIDNMASYNNIEGVIDIRLNNWVYPRSGVVFIWNEI